MSTRRNFGPVSSDGVPIRAGAKVQLRVRQTSGDTQRLARVKLGIAQLEPEGTGGATLPDIASPPPGEWGDGSAWHSPGNGDLYVVRDDGSRAWSAPLPSGSTRSVAYADGVVYAVTDTRLYAFDPENTNDVLWDVPIGGDGLAASRMLAVDGDGNAYVARQDDSNSYRGWIVKFDRADGSELAVSDLTYSVNRSPDLAVHDGLGVVIARSGGTTQSGTNYGDTLTCFEMGDLSERWMWNESGMSWNSSGLGGLCFLPDGTVMFSINHTNRLYRMEVGSTGPTILVQHDIDTGTHGNLYDFQVYSGGVLGAYQDTGLAWIDPNTGEVDSVLGGPSIGASNTLARGAGGSLYLDQGTNLHRVNWDGSIEWTHDSEDNGSTGRSDVAPGRWWAHNQVTW